MAYTFSVNNSPATGSIAMYQLISALISAGWLKKADSDGTTYSATGTQVTSGNSGPNGLGNTSAWVRLQAPAVNGGAITNQKREITIQRSTIHTSWRIKYSAYGNFTGGVPSAAVTPTNETMFAYSELNQDATTSLASGGTLGTGQSFAGLGSQLIAARFYLKKATSPTGFAIAKIYAVSGALGSTSIPTGAALAASTPFDVSTLTTSYALTELKFTGANQITLTNGVNYFVTIEYSGSGGTLDVGRDASSPTAQGNSSTLAVTTWTAVTTSAVVGYVCTGIQDELTMTGTGTDAAPTYTAYFGTDASYRWHISAGGAAEFYSFIAWSQVIGAVTASTAIFLDVMATGSYPATDIDPAVVYVPVAGAISELPSTTVPTVNVTNPSKARAWLGPVSATGVSITSNNVNVGIYTYGSQIGSTNQFGTNAWVNSDDLLPCLYANNNSTFPRGIKGFSTLFMHGTVVRINGDTCDSTTPGAKDKIYFGNLWLPWGGVTPLI